MMRWPWQKPEPIVLHQEEPFRAVLPGEEVSKDARLDVRSETWLFIQRHCSRRIQELRASNDSAILDDRRTAVLRGQIRAMKEILDLPKPKPQIHVEEEDE